MAEVETTNYEKFQTGNPVVRRMFDNFFRTVGQVVQPLGAKTILDAGCGEGEGLERLAGLLPEHPVGIDLNPESVEYARERLPGAKISEGNLLDLPFGESEFDLVLCLEVLEHIPDPAAGLAELTRVSGADIVISVPHEPWFRLGSFARGKYLKTWGNHPEHINHWNPKSFRAFAEAQAEVVEIRTSMPWLIAHCRPRQTG